MAGDRAALPGATPARRPDTRPGPRVRGRRRARPAAARPGGPAGGVLVEVGDPRPSWPLPARQAARPSRRRRRRPGPVARPRRPGRHPRPRPSRPRTSVPTLSGRSAASCGPATPRCSPVARTADGQRRGPGGRVLRGAHVAAGHGFRSSVQDGSARPSRTRRRRGRRGPRRHLVRPGGSGTGRADGHRAARRPFLGRRLAGALVAAVPGARRGRDRGPVGPGGGARDPGGARCGPRVARPRRRGRRAGGPGLGRAGHRLGRPGCGRRRLLPGDGLAATTLVLAPATTEQYDALVPGPVPDRPDVFAAATTNVRTEEGGGDVPGSTPPPAKEVCRRRGR